MTNRTAFATGASRGIGKACAPALADAGARAVVAARTADKLEEAASPIRARGHETYAVELDLSSPESIQAAFVKASSEFGHIDIPVNAAGVARDGLALQMKRVDWDAVLNTNLTGAFFGIRQVPHGRFGKADDVAAAVRNLAGEEAGYIAGHVLDMNGGLYM